MDGAGGGKQLDWEGLRHWSKEQGVLWAHFNMRHGETQQWIQQQSGLDPIIAQALLVPIHKRPIFPISALRRLLKCSHITYMLRFSKPVRLDLEKISSFMDGH
jgi:hypothetical protein